MKRWQLQSELSIVVVGGGDGDRRRMGVTLHVQRL